MSSNDKMQEMVRDVMRWIVHEDAMAMPLTEDDYRVTCAVILETLRYVREFAIDANLIPNEE